MYSRWIWLVPTPSPWERCYDSISDINQQKRQWRLLKQFTHGRPESTTIIDQPSLHEYCACESSGRLLFRGIPLDPCLAMLYLLGSRSKIDQEFAECAMEGPSE